MTRRRSEPAPGFDEDGRPNVDELHRVAAAEDRTWQAAGLSLDEQLRYMNAQVAKPKVARTLRDRGLDPDDLATPLGSGTLGSAIESGELTIAEALGRLGRAT